MRVEYFAKTIIALLLPIHLWCCAPSLRQDWARNHAVPVRFVFIDARAASVCLSGSFNQWSPQSHCLQRNGSTWSITVPLGLGRYQYGFVIDGEDWQADPGAILAEESGFGRFNSVLIVE
jgi:1,4-alpha-glucan branching enzyme